MARTTVYIAGPISKGDLIANIRQADRAFRTLAVMGFAPLCPHWSVFAGSIQDDGTARASAMSGLDLSHEDWMEVDLPWVERADAVLRLPGESLGADREVAHAKRAGIPVYDSIQDLLEDFP